MNELKPEDVMRALECCAEEHCGEWCPFYDETPCEAYLAKAALALLREKDAHIKMLDKDRLGWADEAVKAQMQLNEKDAEIERLTVNMNGYAFTTQTLSKEFEDYRADVRMEIADTRAEAITEFAERIKKFYANLKGKTVGGSVGYHIDQIAKELRDKV